MDKKELNQGIIESYIHTNKRIGVLLELRCQTDFVAKTDEFKTLAHELCLQIAAMNPKKSELIKQPWIKDESKKVKDLLSEYKDKLGEDIVVRRFIRYDI